MQTTGIRELGRSRLRPSPRADSSVLHGARTHSLTGERFYHARQIVRGQLHVLVRSSFTSGVLVHGCIPLIAICQHKV